MSRRDLLEVRRQLDALTALVDGMIREEDRVDDERQAWQDRLRLARAARKDAS